MTRITGENASILKQLEKFPRRRIAHLPTPLEAMENLSKQFEDVSLFVKRDDCTGLGFGGNKVRQLEFYFGQAIEEGADTILITGAVQSNFVRTAAAGARKLGMDCHLQLEERVPDVDDLHRSSGNVLLDNLLGATLHFYPAGEDESGADANMERLAAELRATGARPYVIPLGPGHDPLGALGYVDAAAELLVQLKEQNLNLDQIFVASGSGATHAGLLFGLRTLGSQIPVIGVCPRRNAVSQAGRIQGHVARLAAMLELEPQVSDADIHLTDVSLAPGYGRLNDATHEALELTARSEGLFLDPVYTAKTMAGLIHMVRAKEVSGNLLFWHTGGQPALFAYANDL